MKEYHHENQWLQWQYVVPIDVFSGFCSCVTLLSKEGATNFPQITTFRSHFLFVRSCTKLQQ
jgi:hypothetical protein